MRRLRHLLANVSIALSAPLLMAVPVLLAVVLLGGLSYLQGRRTVDELSSQIVDQVGGRIEGRLNDFLDIAANVNGLNTHLIATGRLNPNDLRGWADSFNSQLREVDGISSLCFGTPDGHTVWLIRYGDEYEFAIKDELTGPNIEEYPLSRSGEIMPKLSGSYAYDPTQRPWYQTGVANPDGAFTDVYSYVRANAADGEGGVLGLGFAQEVRDETGEFIGVMDTEVTLGDITTFLQSLRIAESGVAFVINHEGHLVGTSVNQATVDDQGNRIRGAQAQDPSVRVAAAALRGQVGDYATLSPDGTQLDIDVNGRRARVSAFPFRSDHELPWVIVTVVPDIDFMAGVYEARRWSLFAGIGATLAALLLGVIAARQLAHPIIKLAGHLKQMGTGDLDTRLRLDVASELRDVADEVNEMQDHLKDRLRLRSSLALAMEVQQSLLPNRPPSLPGLDIAGRSAYCDETGGDYFDFIDVLSTSDENQLVLALGDVMGHGVAAALLMTTARASLRSRARDSGSLADLLTHVNELLVPDTGGLRFMTMVLAVLDPTHRTMRWASAGHDAPMIYSPETDTFDEPEGGDVPLGVVGSVAYDEYAVGPLPPGAIILLGTDGIWETQNAQQELYGKDRLQNLIRAHRRGTADEIAGAIHEAVNKWAGDAAPHDDVTMVVVKLDEAEQLSRETDHAAALRVD
ncbi:MAG: SpoIIE family protein phosphatase [Planctomycetota bacterium]